MKIAAIPLNIAWADPEENLKKVEKLIEGLEPGTDIVVLPELFSTGFMQDTDVMASQAETSSGPTLTKLLILAHLHHVAIAGSMLFKVGKRIYNHGFFIDPMGDEIFYDKRHLFSLSSESKTFTAGDTLPPVIRYRGWNVSLIVCYDLRFPVWCRNKGHRYDIMLVPANWPEARGYAWKQLLSARAIENQAVYVGANRGGSDDFGDYTDLTFIYDSMGKDASRKNAEMGVIYAEIEREEFEKVRQRLPFGSDADDFEIIL